MEKEIKFYKFSRGDGDEIVIAENASKAINYFFNEYLDDSQIDDSLDFGTIEIEHLTDGQLTEKHSIFNEETGKTEMISYKEISADCETVPCVIVSPNY